MHHNKLNPQFPQPDNSALIRKRVRNQSGLTFEKPGGVGGKFRGARVTACREMQFSIFFLGDLTTVGLETIVNGGDSRAGLRR